MGRYFVPKNFKESRGPLLSGCMRGLFFSKKNDVAVPARHLPFRADRCTPRAFSVPAANEPPAKPASSRPPRSFAHQFAVSSQPISAPTRRPQRSSGDYDMSGAVVSVALPVDCDKRYQHQRGAAAHQKKWRRRDGPGTGNEEIAASTPALSPRLAVKIRQQWQMPA